MPLWRRARVALLVEERRARAGPASRLHSEDIAHVSPSRRALNDTGAMSTARSTIVPRETVCALLRADAAFRPKRSATRARVSRGFRTYATAARRPRALYGAGGQALHAAARRARRPHARLDRRPREDGSVRASACARRTPRRHMARTWMAGDATASRRGCRRCPPVVIALSIDGPARPVRSPSRRGLLSCRTTRAATSASRRSSIPCAATAIRGSATSRRSPNSRALGAQGRRARSSPSIRCTPCLRKIARASVRIIRPTGVSSIRSISISLGCEAHVGRADRSRRERPRPALRCRRGCRLSRRHALKHGGARTRLRRLP